MTRGRMALVAGLLLLAGCAEKEGGDDTAGTTPSTAPPVVADAAWCAGWRDLVTVQGQYVAAPTQENADAMLAEVESLRALGVPESLDPAGYTELTAVLDDVRASVDPSFTPSVVPTEPADVVTEGGEHGHEHEDEDEAEHEAEHDDDDAPFGAWLAAYCP